jgi:hypothetical protein
LGHARLFVVIAIAIALSTTLIPISDLRGGNEWIDSYYNAGFSDGQDEPFSQSTYNHRDTEPGGADAYYDGFIDGCMAVEGNTRDVCESATFLIWYYIFSIS